MKFSQLLLVCIYAFYAVAFNNSNLPQVETSYDMSVSSINTTTIGVVFLAKKMVKFDILDELKKFDEIEEENHQKLLTNDLIKFQNLRHYMVIFD